jgi:5-(carboxyamino)imidazole ribonucleotide synthase
MLNSQMIPPGAIIGCLGDGQLGRMIGIAAAQLGYRMAYLGPGGRDSPAGHVAYWIRPWDIHGEVNEELLDEFCSLVSVVVIEWENVPLSLVKRIEARGRRVCPDSRTIEIAQDRKLEKELAESLGIPVGEYQLVSCIHDFFVDGTDSLDYDAVMKLRRNGYDGHGQIRIKAGQSVKQAWRDLKNAPCILERKIDFACELSVIVVRKRASTEKMVTYGPFKNTHEDGILRSTLYPAQCSTLTKADLAKAMHDTISFTQRIAEFLDLDGILTVEYFVSAIGEVLLNEIAPRPHNSGHLTIDCSNTCQFKQYVLAACNRPFGSSEFHHGGVMHNILGDEIDNILHLESELAVHLYGKSEARKGRKMGHVTRRIPLLLA